MQFSGKNLYSHIFSSFATTHAPHYWNVIKYEVIICALKENLSGIFCLWFQQLKVT